MVIGHYCPPFRRAGKSTNRPDDPFLSRCIANKRDPIPRKSSVAFQSADSREDNQLFKRERLLLAEQEGAVPTAFSGSAAVVDHAVGDKGVVARGLRHLNVPLTDTA